MCSSATCATCSKTTWRGCGNHIAQALDSVPEAQRCTCEPRVTFDGKEYPPKAATSLFGGIFGGGGGEVKKSGRTTLLNFIRLVEQHIFETFSVETDASKRSGGQAATSVEGKFYPAHFQPWADFGALHHAKFHILSQTFSDNAIFPGSVRIESLGDDLSPRVADEAAVRPFIRASIEKPAARIVSKYLETIGHQKIKAVKFQSNAYGMHMTGKEAVDGLADPALPRTSYSPTKSIGIPDRWLVARTRDDRSFFLAVGEIKPPHVFHGDKLARVFSAPPTDDFFPRAARLDSASTATATATPKQAQVPGEISVAKALCQTYHYMVSSGLEYGYLATGDGLVFLRVPEDDPNTLYYHWSVFPVNQVGRIVAAREPRDTALAHVATLCLLSIDSVRRPMSWIDARNDDVKRWPKPKKTTPSLTDVVLPDGSPDESGGDAGGSAGGSAGGATSGRSRSPLKRTRSQGPGSANSGRTTGASKAPRAAGTRQTERTYIVRPPVLPYCTQACLRSLCRGLPMDKMCPNAELHQAATRVPDSHALTASQIQARVVAQLRENMDRDCQSFFFDGDFGRYGVLYKITVTGFGYTMVAKAVMAQHRFVLQCDVAVYDALPNFQGRLIPVCLGMIDLARPIPLGNCQYVSHMLLMSYAGPGIDSKSIPSSVDVGTEVYRTKMELSQAGLWNRDAHSGNFSWNEEVQRVMSYDFDDAWVERGEPEPEPEPERSPLQTKRDINALHGDGKPDDNGQAKKRARAAT